MPDAQSFGAWRWLRIGADAMQGPNPFMKPSNQFRILKMGMIPTYTSQFQVAVTALWGSCQFFDVVVDELSTGGLDYMPTVGGGVVRLALAKGDTLGHCGDCLSND